MEIKSQLREMLKASDSHLEPSKITQGTTGFFGGGWALFFCGALAVGSIVLFSMQPQRKDDDAVDIRGLLRMLGLVALAIAVFLLRDKTLSWMYRNAWWVLALMLTLTSISVTGSATMTENTSVKCGDTGSPHTVTVTAGKHKTVTFQDVGGAAELASCVNQNVTFGGQHPPTDTPWSTGANCAPMTALPAPGDILYGGTPDSCHKTAMCVCESETTCDKCA